MSIADTSCDILFFGALGDLTQRKLLPALYQLERANLLSPETRIIGLARDSEPTESLTRSEANLRRFVAEAEIDSAALQRFLGRLQFLDIDFGVAEDYRALRSLLDQRPGSTRIFYYSTAASIYGMISAHLDAAGCIDEHTRVVLEKPIGHSLESSHEVNAAVAQYYDEAQIYRIDHYLGKETVQNLIALRFANNLFGNQWNQNHISHVEITVAEKVGIEGRWDYFDKYGQLRDMVQNHLLQLLCLVAMDPPSDLSADAIRDEKVKVLKALRPITDDIRTSHLIRGQYSAGQIGGETVPGYLEEPDANTSSNTESFVAIKAEIRNWRWAGVPFYLRTGKRMPEKLSQITIHFRQQPHYIFDPEQRKLAENQLTIKLQPDEGISLQIITKDQGLDKGMQLRAAPLQLSFSQAFEMSRVPDAYERLLLEVIKGNQYLFVRRDEIENAWKWCDQILEHWQDGDKPLPYAAGSWGPEASDAMLAADGRAWHEHD
ncbi:glucose-6-phosphate 1-dehydrogenase [Marinobacterium nitratireducens]|uniref:Glucose-6-phosphate 1-dehydrogenase n=1 Tax=Marinobacterium nitratireducens TaxID=518897 RepID=A0A917ZLC6_9GAMM|nr:glucose-6-phosphate dehydrogenase [Marinobacterium nitratireducens]GGO85696.1 glucose-6-phosphate 1-dehydrogenase [Marinobacterium nitratireducens]